MTDKEIIKQEIERRIDLYSIAEKDDSTFARMGELSSLIDFIDSLPEESTSEDLEEEIERCWKEMFPNGWSDYTLLTLTYDEHKAFARHFAEWQREKDIKLEKIDDLEKFAQKWAYSNYHQEQDGINCDCLYSGVKKGVEWYENHMKEILQTEYEKGRSDMREEMMKTLVEGEIVKDVHNQLSVKSEPLNDTFGKFGDKVKIIVIKQD